MKSQKMRDMTGEELVREHAQLKEALFKLRLQKATGQLEKPHVLRETRRDIARAATILRERGVRIDGTTATHGGEKERR